MEEKRSTIFHIDVNSAFLSWSAVRRMSQGEDMDLRNIPSVIGGDEQSRRGVVLAKSNLAKQYGIVTGESLYSAKKKCPNLVIVAPDFNSYRFYSKELVNMLKNYSPCVEQYSIDECFLDMGILDEKDACEEAYAIKERIKEELGFTVNIGISNKKVLAKMASEFNKPDKINTLYSEEIRGKLWPLPVGELFMVGRKAKEKLNKLYIFTIEDLAKHDVTFLKQKFKSYGSLIWEYANGIDSSKVQCQSEEVKIISNSITLPVDVVNKYKAHDILVQISEQISIRLRKENKFCSGIAVNIKNKDFISYSHQKKLANPTNSTKHIGKIAQELFDEAWKKEPIRLLGISLYNLSEEFTHQVSIFDETEVYSLEKNQSLDKALDLIKEKFGDKSIKRFNNNI